MKFRKLISAAENREPWAQRRIVDNYSPYLFLIANRYSDTKEDAQDILQDALVNIINNIHQYKSGEDKFKAWMKRICINVALSKKRKMSYTREIYPGEVKYDASVEPTALHKLGVSEIIALIQFLPETQRQVFNLYIIDGFKHSEIAKMLDMGESTSRTTLTRARKKMQRLIFEQEKIRIDESLR